MKDGKNKKMTNNTILDCFVVYFLSACRDVGGIMYCGRQQTDKS